MTDITKVPSIPPIPVGDDPALFRFLQAIRETILVREGQKGNELDATVTFRDLIDAGIAVSNAYKPNPNTTSVVGAAAVTDSTPPPDPFNVNVSPGVSSVFLTWELPTAQSNLAYIKIWRSADNTFSNAQIVGTGSGITYVDYSVIEGQPYHYWLQSVSTSDVAGSLVDAGVATPSTDPTGALTQLKQYGVDGLPYYYVPTDTTINGVSIPRGTYLWNAVIGNAAIGTAQIKDAAITSAKVASLTADKIVFNQASGQVFNAAVITGGLIQGTQITGNTITGGLINGSRIISGGSLTVPAAEMSSAGYFQANGDAKIAGNPDSYDFARVESGAVNLYTYIPTVGHQATKALTRVEAGEIINGAEILLGGYWSSEPFVMVSPKILSVYDKDQFNADQQIKTGATLIRVSENPALPGFYKYRLKAFALLEVAAGGTVAAIAPGTNMTGVSSSGDSVSTSSTVNLPVNAVVTVAISATVQAVNYDGSNSDIWQHYHRVRLIQGGRVVAETTFAQTYNRGSSSYTPTTATGSFTVTTTASGNAYIEVYTYISGYYVRNSDRASQSSNIGKTITVSQFTYATSGSAALASGTLNYIAIGQ